jgi:hypothetical protein
MEYQCPLLWLHTLAYNVKPRLISADHKFLIKKSIGYKLLKHKFQIMKHTDYLHKFHIEKPDDDNDYEQKHECDYTQP